MEPDPEALSALLVRSGLGDRDAFRRFYEATAGQVYALGIRMLGDGARAEDLLQDVYLKVWHRSGEFRPGRGDAMAWLITMARNRAIDLGRAAHQRDTALDDLPEPEASAHEEPPRAEQARLAWCLEQLESGQRQTIFCAFFTGLSHGEIARRFSEPVGTIKTRIRRGLANLKQCLRP